MFLFIILITYAISKSIKIISDLFQGYVELYFYDNINDMIYLSSISMKLHFFMWLVKVEDTYEPA